MGTKFSGYLPLGKKTSFVMSGMTMSSMSLIRNSQCPPSTPLLDPPSWQTFNGHINTKFSGYLPWGKKSSFMTSGIPKSSMSLVRNPQGPPSTPLLDPPSWHTSNWDISTKCFCYLPWSRPKSSIDCMVIGPKAQVMGQRPKQQPSTVARIKGL